MKKVILFDLDGTLLPMDQGKFTKAYFGALMDKLTKLGVVSEDEEERNKLIDTLWKGIRSMMNNDGSMSNEKRFLLDISTIKNADISIFRGGLDGFYKYEFNKISAVCDKNSLIPEVISDLKGRGYRLAVATNPVFPLEANERRLEWAGMSLSDFEYCTCYENSRFCKPNLHYYMDILDVLGVSASDCLMVGNDVREDMVAKELGMDVFLITDYIINVENYDISKIPHGSWENFWIYMQEN